MLPGFGGDLMTKGQEEQSVQRIKRCITILDSMTAQELDSDGKILNDDKRVMRIARGAGVHPLAVREVLEMYKPLQKMGAGMKKLNLPIGKNGEIPKMAMNGKMDQRQMQQMASMLPPQMMQKVGGAAGLQQMMKQLSGGGLGGLGNMPGMADMMKMFGGGK
jgi:signal recognition particle subunit SRP54